MIINYMKPYNCLQTIDLHWIDVITWNHLFIRVK